MDDSSIRYNHEWSIIKTEYSVLCRKSFHVTEIDKIICGIILNEGGKIIKQSLGLLLGFAVTDLFVNEDIVFNKDEVEILIFEDILKPLFNFHLINEYGTEIFLTKWGQNVVTNNIKYKFYDGKINLYKHLNIDTLSKPFPFNKLHLFPSIKNLTEVHPYDTDTEKNELTILAEYDVDNSPDDNNFIVDIVNESYVFKQEILLPCSVAMQTHTETIELFFRDVEICELSELLSRPENLKLKKYLIKKGHYNKLLNSTEEINSVHLLEYKEFFNWIAIIQSRRINWNDRQVFDVFRNSEISNGSLWSSICSICPVEIIIGQIDSIRNYINWSVLTEAASNGQILNNYHLEWEFEVVIEKFSEGDLLQYIKIKLSGIEKENYLNIISLVCWSEITRKLSNESLENYLSLYPLDFGYISRNYLDLTTKSILLSEHLLKSWDWGYISAQYDIEFLSLNFISFGQYLNPEKLFLRIAKEEDRLIRFLKSHRTTHLRDKLKSLGFRISYHDVVLNQLTIPLLDENGLLAWGINEIQGVECNPNIIWSISLFSIFKSKINSNKGYDFVSSKISSLESVINSPTFKWNFINIANTFDNSALLANFNYLIKIIPVNVLPKFFESLSNKFSLKETLICIEHLDSAQYWDLERVILNTDSDSLDHNIISLIAQLNRLNISDSKIVSAYTRKATLNFVITNVDLDWDWGLITKEKISKEDLQAYFTELSPYLDWVYIISNIYTKNDFNNLDSLTELAVYVSSANTEMQKSTWAYITSCILKDNIWEFIEKTENFKIFKWDWTILSGSKDFMFSRISDVSFLWNKRFVIDWSAFTINTLFQNLLRKVDGENNHQYLDRIREYLDTFENFLDWEILSSIPGLTKNKSVLIRYIRKWNWQKISKHSNFFTKYDESTKKRYFSEENIEDFASRIDFDALTTRDDVNITGDFVRKYAHKPLNWLYLSSYPKLELSHDLFIEIDDSKNIEFALDKFSTRIADKKWDYSILSHRKELRINSELIKALIDKEWDWKYLSSLDFLSNEILMEAPDKNWDFTEISKNKNLVFDKNLITLLKNKSSSYIIDWYTCSSSQHFHANNETLSLLPEEVLGLLNWKYISASHNLHPENISNNFLNRFCSYLSWGELLTSKKIQLSNDILRRFHAYIDSTDLANYISLETLFGDENAYLKPLINWAALCKRSDVSAIILSEQFLDKHKTFIDWETLSSNTKISFSKEILGKYKPFWEWNLLSKNPVIKESLSDEVNSIIENDRRIKFLCKLAKTNSPWHGYVYHFTHLSNAIDIIKSGKIQSRNSAIFEDSAGSVVNRRDEAHNYARFYFRPQTPTQFYNEELGHDQSSKNYERALIQGLPKCPIPIFFRFSLKEIFFDDRVEFKISNGNMQTNWAQLYDIDAVLNRFDFDDVYSTFANTTDSNFKTYINSSQQEFLVRNEFDFSDFNCYQIIVPNNMIKEYLISQIQDEITKRKVIIDNGSLLIYHHRNKSIEINNSAQALVVSTNYRNNHKFKIQFKSAFLIDKIEGNNIIGQEDSITFDQTISISFLNKPSYELYFYNEIKSKPWTLIHT